MAQEMCRNNDGMPATTLYEKSAKCTICTDEFQNLQDCLKHELLKHRERPKKTIRQKLNLILPIYKNDVKLLHHMKISSALSQCSPGEELNIVMKHSLLDPDSLSIVYTRIQSKLKDVLRPLNTLKIHPFGSFVTGLALQSSDFDIYIEFVRPMQSGNQYYSNRTPEQIMYNRIDKILRQSSEFSHVYSIRHARVPIIKCKHVETGFSLDINLACPSSVQNTNFLRDLLKFDHRLHELMVFLKVWAKVMQLIGRGNMSSYFITMLAIFYLQQEQPNRTALIPPIEKLQKDVEPETINGVNYAYNLQANMPIWPTELTTTQLIKGFFRFYRDFAFETELIAPYLGKTIPLELFKSGSFKYPAYENQSRAILILKNKKMADIEVANCVCVQDIFSLTHNVGKPIKPINLEYFRRCIIYAYNFSSDPVIKTNAQLYHAWLYEIVPCIAKDVTANQTMETKDISVATSQPTNSNGNTATTAKKSKNTVKVTNTVTRTISNITSTIATSDITSSNPSNKNTNTSATNWITNITTTAKDSSTSPSPSKSDTNTSVTNLNTSTTDTDSTASNISFNSLLNQLVHNIYPVRTDLRAIALHNNINDEESLHKLWIQYYTQAVVDVITNIYCIDMQSVLPTHGDKQQRLEDEELQRSWLLSGSVDVWTGRTHQRSRNNAMELQLAQTENFMRERRQQAAYAVNLCGKLTLNIVCNWKAIQLVLEPANKNNLWALCKKDPLRKFFLMFKNTMQNYNLKDTVLAGRFGVQGVSATETDNDSTAVVEK